MLAIARGPTQRAVVAQQQARRAFETHRVLSKRGPNWAIVDEPDCDSVDGSFYPDPDQDALASSASQS
jgi:hypothetical protein